jgi:hypothetical protein
VESGPSGTLILAFQLSSSSVVSNQLISGQLISGQLSVVSGQLSVVSGQWSVVSGSVFQWSVDQLSVNQLVIIE